MTYTVKWTSVFKKIYKRAKKRGLNMKQLQDVVNTLQQGLPLDKKYKDPELSGKLHGLRECHIQNDWLLVYLVEHNILTLTFVDTGTHSDLF